jgi:(2R)-3-sulfolactate dehydrogenase (NADP+)
MPTISSDALLALASEALEQAGANQAAAAATARSLVLAEASGLASHGVSRIPLYCAHLRNKRVNGSAQATLQASRGATCVIDADDGLAYPACDLAVAEAITRAREFGIGLAAVVRSNHFGVAAQHLEAVAEAGLVGLALGNSPAAIAPWGGKKPLFGTNPIAAVFPRRDHPPLVIDLSLSEVARGKLLVAAQNKQPIPYTWALDVGGLPTNDPAEGLRGSMLPTGGVKGAMLALWVELLIGAVVGASFGFEADSFFAETGNQARLGQLFLAIDPGALAGLEHYHARLETLVDIMLDDEGVRLPGSRREQARRLAQSADLKIPDKLLAELHALRQTPHQTQAA